MMKTLCHIWIISNKLNLCPSLQSRGNTAAADTNHIHVVTILDVQAVCHSGSILKREVTLLFLSKQKFMMTYGVQFFWDCFYYMSEGITSVQCDPSSSHRPVLKQGFREMTKNQE